MMNVLTIALSALLLPAGTALAEPRIVELGDNTAISDHDGLSQESAIDLKSVVGGERSHSCRTNSVAGAVLATAGLALGSHWLTAIGTHLIVLSETVCY